MTVDPRDIRALDPLVRRVRTDITAKKTKVNGKTASFWTDEPLTDALLAQHLNGGPARGVCPISAGGKDTMVGVFDLDDHAGAASWADMALVGAQLYDVLEIGFGCTPIAWRSSGGRGIHLMLVWDAPQDAYSVRQFMFRVLDTAGYAAGTKGVKAGQIEVFPKQDSVKPRGSGPGSNGNMFVLPLAGASELLEMCDLSGMLVSAGGRPAVWGLRWDGRCEPVPRAERPVRISGSGASGSELVDEAKLLSALDAIPNAGAGSLDYDTWFKVMCGVHHSYGGDPGLDAAIAFSAKSERHEEGFLTDRVWPYIRSDRHDGVTAGTIYHLAALAAQAAGRVWCWPPLSVDTFDVVVADAGPGGAAPLQPIPYTRDRNGAILPTMGNAALALRRPDACGWQVGHDEFKDEIMLAAPGAPHGDGWRPLKDADISRIRIELERSSFKTAPKDLARDAVVLVADENRFDSALMWLERIERTPGWDGVPRCERFLVDYFGAVDDPAGYVRACGRYLWTAFAGRVLAPGCQVDMIVTLTGGQGLRKTSAIVAMVPAPEFAIEVDFSKDEEDTARLMRGALVGEVAELRGLHTKDQDAIKKFITRRHENWIPKYKEFSTTFPRRLVFVGSVNPSSVGFLGDETGERRWLPVEVSRADVEGIAAVREQLWAEGAAMWRAGGVAWADAERLAAPMHEEFGIADEWEEPVTAWLAGADGLAPGDGEPEIVARGMAREGVRLSDIASGALGIPVKDTGMQVQKRLGAILRKLGYAKHRILIGGLRVWRWLHESTVQSLGALCEEK